MYTPAEFTSLPWIVPLSDQVAYQWIDCGVASCQALGCPRDIKHLWVWHLCDGSALPNTPMEGWYPRWAPTGVQAHDLVQVEPLTVSPSILWPLCCGLHGYITDGHWLGV